MGKQPQIVEIKMAAVEAMVERAKGLLAKEDHDLLKGLVDTLLTLVGLVRKGRTTIARLRRLVGMVSTEKTTEVLGKLSEGEASAADGTADPAEHNEEKPAAENNAAAGKQSSTTETAASPKPDTGAQAATKPKGHGRLPASDYPDATHITVAHESLSPGDICPACGRGKLYALKEPARFLRIRSKVGLGNRSLEKHPRVADMSQISLEWSLLPLHRLSRVIRPGRVPCCPLVDLAFLNRQEPPNL